MPYRILVIEDHPDLRESTGELLEYEGYEVILAENGLQGLALARSVRPAAILSDLHMPGMNGYELARHLQADPATSHIPLLVASANFDRTERPPGCPAGVAAFLAMPYERTVNHKFRRLWAGKPQRR